MKILDYEGLKLVIERLKSLISLSIDNHKGDTDIHTTKEQKDQWTENGKTTLEHIKNIDIHVNTEEKTKWNNISNVENQITSIDKDINDIKVNVSSDLMIRVKQLESGLYEDIKGNPFFVNFRDLDGVKLTNGVFNEKQARLEC